MLAAFYSFTGIYVAGENKFLVLLLNSTLLPWKINNVFPCCCRPTYVAVNYIRRCLANATVRSLLYF